MKLYILVVNSRNDGGDENINIEPYETEQEARKAFNEAIKSDREEVKLYGWETEITDTSYESYEPGYEMQNHYSVSIREVELKGNHRVRTVYSDDLLGQLEENDGRKLSVKNAEKRCPAIWNLCERIFDTQAEVDAYHKGQSDQDVWQNDEPGEDHPEITDEVWKKFGNPED